MSTWATFCSFIFKFLRPVDNVILNLIGAGQPGKYDYVLPKATSPLTMEEQLIRDFFANQPSGFRLFVLRLYVFAKRIAYKAIRKFYGIVQKMLHMQKVDHG